MQKDINYICEEDNKLRTIEPLTVGIFAEWGVGKTRLLKEIKQEIIDHNIELKKLYQHTKEQEAKEFYEKATIIPIFFNAWRFEKEEHLIIPLFKTILEEVKSSDFIPIKDKLYVKLYILSVALINNLQIPTIDFKKIDFKKLLGGDFTQLTSNIKDFFNLKGISKESNFENLLEDLRASGYIDSIYLNIPQWIEKIAILDNVRFVFLVDDLDRCLPENSIKMLESIKLFLDVPGCSFVLAVDDDIIERGVEYHYKEYHISQDNHTIINCLSTSISQEKQNRAKENNHSNKIKKTQLPITGNEYLEKIVQLPFRIPHFDEEDVKTLFETNFEDIFIIKNKNIQTKELRKPQNKKIKTKKDEELLNFLSKNTPPNARKILRVGNLYKLKYDLIQTFENKENIDKILIAKITLLELFAPKLFRYCKNNGIEDTFKRVEQWIEDKDIQSLREITKISNKIKEGKLPQKEADIAYMLLEFIDDLVHSRIPFDVDNIFQNIDYNKLISYIYLKPIKEESKISDEENITKLPPKDINRFEEYIFSNDELSWKKAFSEDENLQKHFLDPYFEFYKKAKEFANNPKWLKIVSKHLNKNEFLELLKQTKPFEGLIDE